MTLMEPSCCQHFEYAIMEIFAVAIVPVIYVACGTATIDYVTDDLSPVRSYLSISIIVPSTSTQAPRVYSS